jgi:transglutaminase-like putative cysteine protease
VLYRVRHVTAYHYEHDVSLAHNRVSSQPRDTQRQECRSHHLLVEPEPQGLSRYRDAFGNWLTYFTLEENHDELVITLRSDVYVEPFELPDYPLTLRQARSALLEKKSPRDIDALQFVFASTYVEWNEAIAQYAREFVSEDRPLLDSLLDLTSHIFKEFKYSPGTTTVNSAVVEVFAKRCGVCQDFAHLGAAMIRSLGLPARYVSGYLLTHPAPGQPRLIGADASHAWFSVYLPGWGWLDLDPTNNCRCNDQHITQAWGRDYADVAPVRGVVLGGGRQGVKVSVDVQPLPDDPPIPGEKR